MPNNRRDVLDGIFMTKEQTKYFNLGKKQGAIELKREMKNKSKPVAVDDGHMEVIAGHEKRLKLLERNLLYWKKRCLRFENKFPEITMVLERLGCKQVKREVLAVWESGLGRYDRGLKDVK